VIEEGSARETSRTAEPWLSRNTGSEHYHGACHAARYAGPVPGDEEPEFVEPGRPEIEARADRQLESRADDPRNRDSA